MTPQPVRVDVEEGRRLLEAMTGDPWIVVEPLVETEPLRIIGNCDCDADDEGRPVYTHDDVCEIADTEDEPANAAAIAWMGSNLRALLSEVEALREEVARLREALADTSDAAAGLCGDIEREFGSGAASAERTAVTRARVLLGTETTR